MISQYSDLGFQGNTVYKQTTKNKLQAESAAKGVANSVFLIKEIKFFLFPLKSSAKLYSIVIAATLIYISSLLKKNYYT